MTGVSTDRKVIRKKAFDNKYFGCKSSKSTQEHGQVEHFVRTVGRNSEIEHSEKQGETAHSSCDEKTETPSLPAEPPETDDGSQKISWKQPDIERISMHIVNMQNCGEITAEQAGRRTEKHNQHHIEITENGFPLKEWFQTDKGM